MAIQVKNLNFSVGRRRILTNICLSVQEGCFTVILGKNGSGKSTLFRLITGCLKPDKGQILIQGRPSPELNIRDRARVLGFLSQHHRPVFPFRVRDVVLTGCAGQAGLLPGRNERRKADEAMDRIAIRHLENRCFTELSGGEQQLVMISRVLAQDPPVILLDEPVSHLDFYFQAKVMQTIRDLVDQNYTVAAILHDPNIAACYGDWFICLKNGTALPRQHPPLDPDLLESIYGMDLERISYPSRTFVLPARSIAASGQIPGFPDR
ncbi:ABC transporter ATP-binding protein [Desulfospira joergensenii]|uniref:ABC transporter ATP-binding protein n=1 Tax=Desulfospira joergensenii TaxID=53329 RepID=UPI000415CDBB|nr:ABC transporter ATP-binding protein [Desulfospira joergensenii]